MGNPITYNVDEKRFEQVHGGEVVYANVRELDGVLYIDHVFAPPVLRGTGAAGCLLEALMHKIRADGLKAKPICGYATKWLRRHSEFHDILISD